VKQLSQYRGRPNPGEKLCAVYTARYACGRVYFAGGPFGSTSIAAESLDDLPRVNAHWVGYCTNAQRRGQSSGYEAKPRKITRAAFAEAVK